MKTNSGFIERTRGRAAEGAVKRTHQTGDSEARAGNGDRKLFRRLKWNELVRNGDFVANGGRSLEPWEGPNGFRADAYVKPIYRRQERSPNGTKKAQ